MRQSAEQTLPIWLVVSCSCMLLVCLSVIDVFPITTFRAISNDITGLFFGKIESVYNSVEEFSTLWMDNKDLLLKWRKAQRELAHHRLLQKEFINLKKELAYLKGALSQEAESGYRKVWIKPAYSIHQEGQLHRLLLATPAQKNIPPHRFVLSEGVVVGKVASLGPNATSVQMITDARSLVPVYIEGRNCSGVLMGTGKRSMVLNYIADNNKVEVGDIIHTKKVPREYETSYPIGKVSSIQKVPGQGFLTIYVDPLFNINYESWYTIAL